MTAGETRICEWCGKPFSAPHTRGPKPRYCRPSHRQRAFEFRRGLRGAHERVSLFQHGEFVLASGEQSDFKIECEALTDDDWECLAYLASWCLPPFGTVEGVPRGGLRFADALRYHVTPGANRVLIADDVWTTGRSWHDFRLSLGYLPGPDVVGVVAFARQPINRSDVIAVFTLSALAARSE